MTGRLFSTILVCHDQTPRSAAMNMAVDEALLESINLPMIRFYRWDHAAVSFGYFGRYGDVAEHRRDIVRRWTGGGVVFHGHDLTYSIAIPASDVAFGCSPMSIYETVHRALCDTLIENGQDGAIVAGGTERGTDKSANLNYCFANPVRADVLMNGRKVAGAAQRRTKRGLLQQGSIQNVDVTADFGERFARALSTNRAELQIDPALLEMAGKISAEKYGTDKWLRRR